MTLRHLKIFLAVCDCGGITRAAEALHITQPAISHTVAELEKYYNVRLFDRINQRLVLTEIGQEVLSKARDIVNGFDEFESFVSLGTNNPKVRIGCSLTLGQTVIPPFMKRVAEEYPHISPKIKIKHSAVLSGDLESGALDFALIEGEVSSPYLLAEPFQKDRLVLVSHADFSVPNTLSLANLGKYPLLLRERGSASREHLEKAVAKYNLHVEPAIESANNQAIVAALYASLGLALLPVSYVAGHIERGKFKEICLENFDGNRTNYLVIHKNKKLNAIGREAYAILKQMGGSEG